MEADFQQEFSFSKKLWYPQAGIKAGLVALGCRPAIVVCKAVESECENFLTSRLPYAAFAGT